MQLGPILARSHLVANLAIVAPSQIQTKSVGVIRPLQGKVTAGVGIAMVSGDTIVFRGREV